MSEFLRKAFVVEKRELLPSVIDKINEAIAAGGVSDLLLEGGHPVKVIRYGRIERLDDAEIPLDEWDSFLEESLKLAKVSEESLVTSHTPAKFAVYLGENRYRGILMPYLRGVSAVLRLLPKSIPSFSQLRFPEWIAEYFMGLRDGLVIFAGATGSGKSTSVDALLLERARRFSENIITLEDPIEYEFPTSSNDAAIKSEIWQREIGVHEASFARGIENAMREAPHVIYFGEIRDGDTLEQALQAAQTGHLVITTFHSATPEQTFQRTLQLIPRERLAFTRNLMGDVTKMIICQRLLRIDGGTARIPIHEVLISNSAIRNSLATESWANMRTELTCGQDNKGWIFARSLKEHFRSQAISREDYLHYAKEFEESK